jgi:anti-sigma-K factor RskA
MTEEECGRVSHAAAWVLGTLSADDAECYAEHLEVCAICRAEVARLQVAADALVDAVPPATPPPELRARLIAAVEAEAALFRAAEEGQQLPEPAGGRNRIRALVLGGLAGLCLVAVGVVVGGLVTSDERGAPVDTVAGIGHQGGRRAACARRGGVRGRHRKALAHCFKKGRKAGYEQTYDKAYREPSREPPARS